MSPCLVHSFVSLVGSLPLPRSWSLCLLWHLIVFTWLWQPPVVPCLLYSAHSCWRLIVKKKKVSLLSLLKTVSHSYGSEEYTPNFLCFIQVFLESHAEFVLPPSQIGCTKPQACLPTGAELLHSCMTQTSPKVISASSHPSLQPRSGVLPDQTWVRCPFMHACILTNKISYCSVYSPRL